MEQEFLAKEIHKEISMGMLDKFLDVMRLNSDDDDFYDDDDYDE